MGAVWVGLGVAQGRKEAAVAAAVAQQKTPHLGKKERGVVLGVWC